MAAILFCFTASTLIPHASPSLQTGVALASTRQSHSQGPASIQAHRTGNGDVNGRGDGDGAGTGTGVEVNEGARNGDGDGDGGGDP